MRTILALALLAFAAPAATAQKLDDVAWIAGDWKGTEGANVYEETWSPPAAASMVGTFRWTAGDEVRMYEFLLIEEGARGVEMRLLHFGPGMEAFHAAPLVFRLTEASPTKAVFVEPDKERPERLVYEKTATGGLSITLHEYRGTREVAIRFVLEKRP